MSSIFNVGFDLLYGDNKNVENFIEGDIIFHEQEFLSCKKLIDPDIHPPIRLDAAIFIFCRYGEAHFNVDYQQHRLTKGSMLRLNDRHILDNVYVPNTYNGYTLMLSLDFIMSVMEWIPPLKNMISSSSNSEPLVVFDENEQRRLVDIVERIKKNLKATDHAFQRYLVKIEVVNFLLELADIRVKELSKSGDKKNNGKEEIVNQFVMLIHEHCKQQHEVSFYAQELCMTPGNLSRIMTNASGKSPMKWISNALVGEAKILLNNPDMNIQRISDELHFGDQSSFGKFFKKHTGFTPLEFRANIQK